MAYLKMADGSFMVCGAIPADAELKQVGQNNSSKTTFSVKASETTGVDGKKTANWTNCVAWHDAARSCASFRKGDIVLVVGKMEEREYNGKKYRDLNVLFAAKMGQPVAVPVPAAAPAADPSQIDLSEFDVLDPNDIPF